MSDLQNYFSSSHILIRSHRARFHHWWTDGRTDSTESLFVCFVSCRSQMISDADARFILFRAQQLDPCTVIGREMIDFEIDSSILPSSLYQRYIIRGTYVRRRSWAAGTLTTFPPHRSSVFFDARQQTILACFFTHANRNPSRLSRPKTKKDAQQEQTHPNGHKLRTNKRSIAHTLLKQNRTTFEKTHSIPTLKVSNNNLKNH